LADNVGSAKYTAPAIQTFTFATCK